MRNLFVMLAAMLLLGGCNAISAVGSIPLALSVTGEVLAQADVYSITSENVAAPNWSQVAVRLPDGVDEDGTRRFKVHFSQPIGGPPLATGLVSGGTNALAAYLFGHSLDPDTYNATTNNTAGGGDALGVGVGVGGGGGDGGDGGSGGAGGGPPDNRPPGNRPPGNRPPHDD